MTCDYTPRIEKVEQSPDFYETDETRSGGMEEATINAGKTFKSDKCVICITNTPNVLFCNCAECVECDEVKSLILVQFVKLKLRLKEIYKIFSSLPGKIFLFISYNAPMLGYVHNPPVYTFYHR